MGDFHHILNNGDTIRIIRAILLDEKSWDLNASKFISMNASFGD